MYSKFLELAFYESFSTMQDELNHLDTDARASLLQAKDNRGDTLLYYAASTRKERMVELLIAAGASINQSNNNHETPLFATIYTNSTEKNLGIVQKLIAAKADVNISDNRGRSPLMLAVRDDKSKEIVLALLEANADVNARTVDDKTALYFAAEYNNIDAMQKLIRAKAEINIVESSNNNTALHIAVKNGHIKAVEILLNAGADTSLRDINGQTALEYAIENNIDCVALFNKPEKLIKEFDKLTVSTPFWTTVVPKITKGIFWKIEKDNLPPSYLLGTLHSNDKRVLTALPSIQAILNGVTTAIVEDPVSAGLVQQDISEVMLLKPGQSLEKILGRKLFNQVCNAFAKWDNAVDRTIIDKYHPCYVKSYLAIQIVLSNSKTPLLDQFIFTLAKSKGKTLIAVNSLDEVLAGLEPHAPIERQKILLEHFLKHYDQEIINVKLLMNSYLEEDLDAINRFAQNMAIRDKDILDLKVSKHAISVRSLEMFKKSVPYLAQGSCLMVFGAFHLVGENGLLENLQTNGYKITNIPVYKNERIDEHVKINGVAM